MSGGDEWLKLRAWNNSLNDAFEELCFQLFSQEETPESSICKRLGAPDAGAEAIWQYPDGTEWGLQAKFFTGSLGASQWRQLDESVRTALENRPNLTVYTIALPTNLPDPKVKGKQSALDKWLAHVKRWESFASTKGMDVKFELWGGSEILSKLSTDDNAGRLYFWFGKEFLSTNWFMQKLDETIKLADERYSPEIHVPLKIESVFDCLARNKSCFSRVKGLMDAVVEAWIHIPKNSLVETLELADVMSQLFLRFESIDFRNQRLIKVDDLGEEVKKALEIAKALGRSLTKRLPTDQSKDLVDDQMLQGQTFYLQQLISRLWALFDFAASDEGKLLERPLLVLTGPAGSGKTHLLCDIAKKRIAKQLPTVILLGEQFISQDPWTQIFHLLGLTPKSAEEFLGALQAAAEAAGSRALLMIDALNESRSGDFWSSHLPRLITAIKRYDGVGLAITVRDTYEDDILPIDASWKNDFVRFEHKGFTGIEETATERYFSHYGIEPSTAPLASEFSNPQFLKLFCKGLNNKGLTKVSGGCDGISKIFEFFIDSVNHKLSTSQRLDFRKDDQLVQQAVAKVASAMSEEGTYFLDQSKTQSLVNELLPGKDFRKSLYYGMLSEGVLSEEKLWAADRHQSFTTFSYQKFTDHLIARDLLNKYLTNGNLKKPFSPTGALYKFVSAETWQWNGICEAFSVQIPEKYKRELHELIPPNLKKSEIIISSFISSLAWRRDDAIFDYTVKLVNEIVLPDADYRESLFDALISISGKKANELNALGLHAYLLERPLSDRDFIWSIYLNYQQSESSPINRLIKWSLNSKSILSINEDVLFLYGIVLTWCFTCSNRVLRDRATKALVKILWAKPRIWIALRKHFETCDDPYLLERLYAAGCGLVLTIKDKSAINEIGKTVYELIFGNGKPYAHELFRNYAKVIVETAVEFGGLELPAETKLVAPFQTSWSNISLANKHSKHDYRTGSGTGFESIWFSLTEGNFATDFVFNRFPWSGKRLDGSAMLDVKAISADFESNLSIKQKRALQNYRQSRNEEDQTYLERMLAANDEELESTRKLSIFKKLLGKQKLATFKKYVLPWELGHIDQYPFDRKFAQKWMFGRVVELGWTEELFGEFDKKRFQNNYGSRSNVDTIGKKYQWIACHELAAYLSDQHELTQDISTGLMEPHELGSRDLDPSVLLTRTEKKPSTGNCWWSPIEYDFEPSLSQKAWIHREEAIPDVSDLIEVINPADESKWCILTASYHWSRSKRSLTTHRNITEKDLFYMLNAYFVKKADESIFFKWATKQDFFGRWMPEPASLNNVYLGEYPWAAAFQIFDNPYNSRRGWSVQTNKKDVPVPIIIAADQYTWEGNNLDSSIEETISFQLPCKWLIDSMHLIWDNASKFLEPSGQLVAFDPSFNSEGPSCLLVRKDSLKKFCADKGYSVVWILYGEKLAWESQSKVIDERLHISGVFRWDDDGITGNTKYSPILWSEFCKLPDSH